MTELTQQVIDLIRHSCKYRATHTYKADFSATIVNRVDSANIVIEYAAAGQPAACHFRDPNTIGVPTTLMFRLCHWWKDRVLDKRLAVNQRRLVLDAEPVVVDGMDKAWRLTVAEQSRGRTIRPLKVWLVEFGGVRATSYTRKNAVQNVMQPYKNVLLGGDAR